MLTNIANHCSQIEHNRALLNQQHHIQQFVPVAQWDERPRLQTVLFAQKVEQDHEHNGVDKSLVKRSVAQLGGSLFFEEEDERIVAED